MTEIVRQANAGWMQEAEQMLRQIDALQEQVKALIRRAKSPVVILPELHEKTSGRIDAGKTAEFMGIPLKQLAESLGLNYKAVHRSPAAAGFQASLRPVKRILELLHEFFPNPESARIWLNTPHPDLNGQSALQIILEGKPEAVLTILENAAAGIPV